MPKPKVIPAPSPATQAEIDRSTEYQAQRAAMPPEVAQAAELLEGLGLPVEFALRDYVTAHTTAPEVLASQAPEPPTPEQLEERHQLTHLLAQATKYKLADLAAPTPTERAAASVQQVATGALGSLVALAQSNSFNDEYRGKLVASHEAGPLGQVVVSHLQQRGVTAVALAGGVIPAHLLGAIHVLSEEAVEYLGGQLSPELLTRLAWLKANPAEVVAVPAQAPPTLATQALAAGMKHKAKLGRKRAGKQMLRRMMAKDLAKQVAHKSQPPRYLGTERYPEQAPPAPPALPVAPAPPAPSSCQQAHQLAGPGLFD